MYDFERRKSLNEIKHRSAFSFALPIMIPMGLSFFFLGLGFGLYATSQGLPWWTAPVLASTIFAGSMEFVTIGLLMAGFDPVNAFILTLFVNGRHFFYGLNHILFVLLNHLPAISCTSLPLALYWYLRLYLD